MRQVRLGCSCREFDPKMLTITFTTVARQEVQERAVSA